MLSYSRIIITKYRSILTNTPSDKITYPLLPVDKNLDIDKILTLFPK